VVSLGETAMLGFLVVVGSILAANVFWWRWADRRLRPLRAARALRISLAAFMAPVLAYLGAYILAPSWARQAHHVLPEPFIALAFLWHLVFLPVGLLIALAGGLTSLPRRLRGTAEGEPVSSRRFLGAVAAGTPPLLTGVTLAAALPKIRSFRVRDHDVPVPGLPPALSGLTIAHVSDTHVGKFTNAAMHDEVVEAVAALAADVVLFTGDLIDLSLTDLDRAIAMAQRIEPRSRFFLCEGNHDRIDDGASFVARVKAAGLPLLRDDSVRLVLRGHPVRILGSRWARGAEQTAAAVEHVADMRRPGEFPILLAHHPHAFDTAARLGIPLTLSGHTHGGQLMIDERLGAGPVLFRYWSGVYERENATLVVSNGVGNWFPLRTAAPAEIVRLRLVPANVT